MARPFLERWGKKLLTLALVLVAAFVGYRLWHHYEVEPRTRDGKVRADVVPVAADVAGYVYEIFVRDNEIVRHGDVLFRVDPARYELAVRQAEAALATASSARNQAEIERRRYAALRGAVSAQERLQFEAQAQQAEASYAQAEAALELARLDLERSTVVAPVDGIVTNVNLRPGTYLNVGTPAMALVDRHSFYVAGYFEETKLRHIRAGDPARVRLMGDDRVLDGHVESIAGAVADRERDTGAQQLPDVNPTFPWVRLAQRVPVRIALDEVPADLLLVAGRTATVEILPSPGGRSAGTAQQRVFGAPGEEIEAN